VTSARKALFTLFVICSLIVACDNPTSPTSIDRSVQVNTGRETNNQSSETISSEDGICGNPSDWISDDSALQACLDGGGDIVLAQGEPGYIINGLNGDPRRGLWITHDGTRITSASTSSRARIIAGRDLFAHILSTPPNEVVNNFSIRHIIFNGMVDEMVVGGAYRRMRDSCFDPGGNPGNISLNGNGFEFRNNASTHAMCGSGLGIVGSNFNIQNNYIAYNGRDRFSDYQGMPWSDGITVISCNGGYIGHNTIVDNTDIDLVIGGGHGCVVELNKIAHYGKYAFAGLNVGNFNRSGNHAGSEFRGNTVSSKVRNRLSIGILVGSHPWTSRVDVVNAGRVVGNTSFGNVINLVVDGVYGGEVTGNNVYNPSGDQGLGDCSNSLNYTVYPPHVLNTKLQSGWVPFQYDGDIACGFFEMISGSRYKR